ncbi:hypothetical protein PIB30_054293 [Stylosanthes scabra]|uniref:Uncharacterized protein n=1 Tax=Stylosanthes scabra TaxID=79078 RepID=A0ABU6XHR0_9FABA|nr:hypothetical protein [Stylosanthes scabra]
MEAMRKEKSSSSPNKRTSNNNMVFPIFSLDMKANTMRTFKALRRPFLACSFSSKPSTKTCRNFKRITWKRFHSQIWQEQEKLAKEIQEVQRSQLTQTLANNKRLEIERNMQLALERQGIDIVEMRKQLNLWTKNTSAREEYTCWAHQQANPNLSEIPITQIPDIMQTNAEKGRPMFYGCLKSDYGASSSSQVDPNEPVPLRTAPPSPDFRPPHLPPN